MNGQSSNLEKTVINISGMSCNHCVQHVEKALQEARGVTSVQVDLNNERAYLEYDTAITNVENLIQAVNDAGYEGTRSEH